MAIGVFSEIGKLKRVLVHRPGREIDWMIPSMMEELLFDDVLFGDAARREHDSFRRVIEAAGAATLDPEVLLAEVLMDAGARAEVIRELESDPLAAPGLAERFADLPAAALAAELISGVRSAEVNERGRYGYFDLPPIPNYFFQRDPQVVLGDRVIVSAMATEARRREPLVARMVFEHHPSLAGYQSLDRLDTPPADGGAPGFLEGGDVLIASPDVLLVGLSERTNRRGVERLAEYLRSQLTLFRQLILVELPRTRSYMHLDTVFTFIDHGTCLAYRPVIESGHPLSSPAFLVDLKARELSFRPRRSLLDALSELGHEVDVVPCGGTRDPIDEEREQWTDGANAFAVAPGVILLYERNRRTVDELSRRGWRVVSDADVLDRGEPVVGAGRTVVTIAGPELSRARGGPRCMTMPLERERLEAP